MNATLSGVLKRYEEVSRKLCDPAVLSDVTAFRELTKESKHLEPIVTAAREYDACETAKAEAQALLSDAAADKELKELASEELAEAEERLAALEQELRVLLLPRDPMDGRDVILEIRGGAGGEESALFAAELFRMYTMYAAEKGWQIEVLSANETELGGVKELTAKVSGDDAYSHLKFESGGHRVQRVPETESGGRIHTSAATVVVMPTVDDVEVDIRPEDVKMDVYRSSGAGGQKVNKTSSAVRLTHIPTGIVVACQTERSQYQNRDTAMAMLRAQLYERERVARDSAVAAERKSLVGSGDRSDRIRTYNFPQGRVTDHRIGLTLYKLDRIMNGDLDELFDALLLAEQTEKLAASGGAL